MKWLLGLWILGISLGMSWLLGFHMVAFEGPQVLGSSVAMAAKPLRDLEVDHFLNARCGCSEKVMKHLIKRGAIEGSLETIHLIDGSKELKGELLAKGYVVTDITEEEASDTYKVVAVPLLRVAKLGKIVYSGAYGNDQKHSPVYRDEEIIQSARDGTAPNALPVFGCINGKLRKNQLDLFGVKYELTY